MDFGASHLVYCALTLRFTTVHLKGCPKTAESVEKVGFLGIDFACRDYPLLCY